MIVITRRKTAGAERLADGSLLAQTPVAQP